MQWNADGQVALGYLFLTVVLVLFALTKPAPRVPEEGEPPSFEGNEYTEAPEAGVPVNA